MDSVRNQLSCHKLMIKKMKKKEIETHKFKQINSLKKIME